MDRTHLIKPSTNPSSDGPRQIEIRELDNPIIEIRDGVRTLVLAFQIIEKTPNGEAPFDNRAVQIKLDGEKIAELATDESGIIEKRIKIENGDTLSVTVPGTVAVFRKKVDEINKQIFSSSSSPSQTFPHDIPPVEVPLNDLRKLIERRVKYSMALTLYDSVLNRKSQANIAQLQKAEKMKQDLLIRIEKTKKQIEEKIAELERGNSNHDL